MAYEKLNLKNGDTLTAEHLQHLEEGIAGAGIQPDWDAVEGEPGYIQNRPFGKTEVILFPETEAAFVDMDGMMMAALPANVKLEADTEYKIVYNAEEYLRKPCLMDGHPVGLGNTVVMGGDDTGEPFFIMIDMDESGVLTAMILALDGTTSTTVSCKGYPEKTLDIKYIPNAAENVIDLEALGLPTVQKDSAVSLYLPAMEIQQIAKQLKMGYTLRFKATLVYHNIIGDYSAELPQHIVEISAPVVQDGTVTAFYHNAMFVFDFTGTTEEIKARYSLVNLL